MPSVFSDSFAPLEDKVMAVSVVFKPMLHPEEVSPLLLQFPVLPTFPLRFPVKVIQTNLQFYSHTLWMLLYLRMVALAKT